MRPLGAILFALSILSVMTSPALAQNNILFVGNSFTHGQYAPLNVYNNANVYDTNGGGFGGSGGVPGVFQKMASDLGYPCNVYIEAVSSQNLAYHYANKSSVIGQSKWNLVVLQDYSTEPTNDTVDNPAGFNIAAFNTATGQLKSLILAANPTAKILLYETWARPDICGSGRSFPTLDAMLNQLRTNYYAANATYILNGVAPVGDAFARAGADGYAMVNPNTPDNSKFNLWYSDKYHESIYGGYLAGAVFIAQITGIDPRNIPTGTGSTAAGLGISSTDAAHMNQVAFEITSTAPTITSANSTNFAAGLFCNFTVTGAGLPSPTFSATGLPAWASLDPVTGVLSGTPPDTSGSPFTITLTATNAAGSSTPQTFTLNVLAPTAPAISNGPPPATVPVNTPYSFTYQASGVPASTFSVTSGSLPPGITLLPTGLLSGTPAVAGVYSGRVSATNGVGSAATQNFTITVQQAPIITNGPAPALVTIGTSYSFSYHATGPPTPTFSVTAGALPPGITLSSGGLLSGTPTVNGTYTFTMTASNGVGSPANLNLTITVQPGPTSQIVKAIDCGSTSSFTASDATVYSADTYYMAGGPFNAGGVDILGTNDDALYNLYRFGTCSYSIPVTNGNYFVDLKFCETNPYQGVGDRVFNVAVQGTTVLSNFDITAHVVPCTPLTETFPATVANGKLSIALTNVTANAQIAAIVVRTSPSTQVAPIIVNSPPSSVATVGTAYGSFFYEASGAPNPTFSVTSGVLPQGLTLTSAGLLSGTPTQVGTYTGVVSAANGVGSAATQSFSITVSGTGDYNQWATTYFGGAGSNISGPAATPRNDGVSNLLKYLCDINPTTTMSTSDRAALPAVGVASNGATNYLTVTYRMNPSASGITILVQTSPDLISWTTVTPDMTQTGTDQATGDPVIEVGVNTQGAARKFIRLNVSMP